MFRHNKYKKSLLIILILIVVTTFALSYAYLSDTYADYSKTNTSISTGTSGALTFIDGAPIDLYADMNNFSEDDGSISSTTTSIANLKSGADNIEVFGNYQVYLNISKNEFVYSVSEDTPELILTVTDPSGNAVTEIEGLTYKSVTDYKTNEVIKGFDITTYEGLIKIKEGQSISSTNYNTGVNQNWTITITFINLNENQYLNAKKKLTANFLLQEEKMSANVELIDNLSLMTDGELLTENYARGFRGESFLFVGSNVAWGGDYPPSANRIEPNLPYEIKTDNDPYRLLDNNRIYEINGEVTELDHMQVYIYLSDYYDKDLDQIAFDQILAYLNKIQELDIQIILRFAYIHTRTFHEDGSLTSVQEVTAEQIVKHTNQLKVFINDNIDLFYDVVYGVQFGMIGIWGEFHSSNEILQTDYDEHAYIMEGVLSMFPIEYDVNVRWPTLFNNATEEQQERLTFHDDNLGGISDDVVKGMDLHVYSPEMQQIFYITQRSISDGETLYGYDTQYHDAWGKIDVEGFVRELAMYGFATISLAHHYKELTLLDPDGDGPLSPIDNTSENVMNMATEYILTEEFLKENSMPYNPAMLTNGEITAFNWIYYHLGYQLGLSNYEKEGNTVSFVLNNFGIGGAINQVIKITDNGNVLFEGNLEDLNMYQFGSYKFTFDNITSSELNIEIYNTVSNDRIRLANDIPYTNGVHTLILV